MSVTRRRLEWIAVGGSSMWPVLRSGDEAALSALEPDAELSPGDVVVARIAGAWVVHRVRGITPDRFVILRGDACLENDAPVRREDVLAVVHRIRRGGRVLLRHEWDGAWRARLSVLGRLRSRAGRLLRARFGR